MLKPMGEGIDAGMTYFDKVRKSLVEADQNFTKINSQKFATEIISLKFELFALAWQHQFGHESAVTQSVFTKHFLQENIKNDIWDACESYNKAIARFCAIGKRPEKPGDRENLARVDKTRAYWFDRYKEERYDRKCIARVVNRFFSANAWKKNIPARPLMFTLCDRLGFEKNIEPNNEAQFRMNAIIHSIYDEARQSLKKYKVKK
jgi:hypothetical protein